MIDWFNGGLFDDDATLPLDEAELKIVLKCAALDWSNIEPSIFGTLFERGLDPDKRSQQGAHYTDPDTIMKIVGPVVLEPWQREWESERAEIAKLIEKAKKTVSEAAKQRYFAFLERLVNFRVLDPACGSGNFLYLALRSLKDFEKRVIHDAEVLGLPLQFPARGSGGGARDRGESVRGRAGAGHDLDRRTAMDARERVRRCQESDPEAAGSDRVSGRDPQRRRDGTDLAQSRRDRREIRRS